MMLNVMPRENLTSDLDSSCYNEALRSMIECLRFSPLAQALTMAESILMVHFSKAYSFAIYSQLDGVVHFEVTSHKSLISNACFCILLGFASTDGLMDPDSISSTALI